MSNPMIINYHDACIYQSDLDLLMRNDSWLNDNILFYEMTHLSIKSTSSGEDRSSVPCSHQIQYLDPSIVEFFMHSLSPSDEDDMEEICNLYSQWWDSNSIDHQVILLVPLNDNNSQGFEGNSNGTLGNHWSLLYVIVRGDCVGSFHFDSSSGYNKHTAELVFERMRDIIKIGRRVNSLPTQSLFECNVPQQQNGYDCGVHTLVTAESFATSNAINSISKMDFSHMKECLEVMVHDFMSKYDNTCEMGRLNRREILDKIGLEASCVG